MEHAVRTRFSPGRHQFPDRWWSETLSQRLMLDFFTQDCRHQLRSDWNWAPKNGELITLSQINIDPENSQYLLMMCHTWKVDRFPLNIGIFMYFWGSMRGLYEFGDGRRSLKACFRLCVILAQQKKFFFLEVNWLQWEACQTPQSRKFFSKLRLAQWFVWRSYCFLDPKTQTLSFWSSNYV